MAIKCPAECATRNIIGASQIRFQSLVGPVFKSVAACSGVRNPQARHRRGTTSRQQSNIRRPQKGPPSLLARCTFNLLESQQRAMEGFFLASFAHHLPSVVPGQVGSCSEVDEQHGFVVQGVVALQPWLWNGNYASSCETPSTSHSSAGRWSRPPKREHRSCTSECQIQP